MADKLTREELQKIADDIAAAAMRRLEAAFGAPSEPSPGASPTAAAARARVTPAPLAPPLPGRGDLPLTWDCTGDSFTCGDYTCTGTVGCSGDFSCTIKFSG